VTTRLYFDDPLLTAFEASVVGTATHDGRPALLLDRSAFYPEAGGQMADRGRLGLLGGRLGGPLGGGAAAEVVDVQLDGERVLHVIEGEAPAVGERVRGEIDRARRRVHMALHTGQHILSRALVEAGGLETVSARLGETACTIDVDSETASDAVLARAEDLANAVIDDDVAVRAFFPSDEELARLPLRRESKVSENVRVVCVGDFDVTPCGGTHCTSSAQVGLIHIVGTERRKRRARITFAAGARARRQLGEEASLLRGLARSLSCGTGDVGAGVDKLSRELSSARAQASALGGVAAAHFAAELAALEPPVLATLDAPLGVVREVAQRLVAARPDGAALLACAADDATHLVLMRGATSIIDCGALMKRAAERSGGKGGGRPERAEGRLPPGIDWPALGRALL
jgi:alanyl-tRNA synthetase